MPTGPRVNYYFDELDANFSSVPVEASVNLPVLSVLGETQSTSITLSTTLVNGGAAAPQAGFGAANGEVFGKIKVVSEDGPATIQDRGYMTFVGSGAAPAVGAPVGVDGTGKVQSTPANKQAFFCGVITDPQSGEIGRASCRERV